MADFMAAFDEAKKAPKRPPMASKSDDDDDEDDGPDAGPDDGPDDEGGSGLNDGERAAGHAAYAALKSGDKDGFTMALKQLVQAMDVGESDDEGPEEGAGSMPAPAPRMG